MKNKHILIDNSSSLEEAILAFRLKLSDILKKESQNLKCPMSHIDALSYIAEKGTPSMKEIASHLKITPPSATAIIEAMQKKKLITRVTNNNDRRTIRVALTSKAWSLFKKFHEQKIAIFTKMLSRLHENEKKQLIKILSILIKE